MKIRIEQLNLGEDDQLLEQIMQPEHMEEDVEENDELINIQPQVESVDAIISLGERDNYLNQIEQQIQAKRELLLEKQKSLKRKMNENQFLEGVYKDYNKYYSYIKKQKEDQITQMEMLNQYLNDIILNGKLTDEDISQSKKEQEEILNTISNIKGELEKIIS